MGEAKRRGTYEQRVEQSRTRAIAREQKARDEAQAWWDSLTDEQKEAEKEKVRKGKASRLKAMQLMALAVSL
jgi:hypothetical protein